MPTWGSTPGLKDLRPIAHPRDRAPVPQVNEDWCRTTCSSGPCPKKLCACGTLEDWAKGKLQTAPSTKPNPLVPAAIKHEMSCISLTPSITDDWCRTTCSQDPAICGDEEWCKCPKASCRCGVAENLVKPGEKAVWEQQKQEGSAPAAPALTCMSFSASVSDYWCVLGSVPLILLHLHDHFDHLHRLCLHLTAAGARRSAETAALARSNADARRPELKRRK